METKNIQIIEILQKIISIPSWVDDKTNEQEIGAWIYEFLKKNSNLKITKQDIEQGRFNILAKKGDKTADDLAYKHK